MVREVWPIWLWASLIICIAATTHTDLIQVQHKRMKHVSFAKGSSQPCMQLTEVLQDEQRRKESREDYPYSSEDAVVNDQPCSEDSAGDRPADNDPSTGHPLTSNVTDGGGNGDDVNGVHKSDRKGEFCPRDCIFM